MAADSADMAADSADMAADSAADQEAELAELAADQADQADQEADLAADLSRLHGRLRYALAASIAFRGLLSFGYSAS